MKNHFERLIEQLESSLDDFTSEELDRLQAAVEVERREREL